MILHRAVEFGVDHSQLLSIWWGVESIRCQASLSSKSALIQGSFKLNRFINSINSINSMRWFWSLISSALPDVPDLQTHTQIGADRIAIVLEIVDRMQTEKWKRLEWSIIHDLFVDFRGGNGRNYQRRACYYWRPINNGQNRLYWPLISHAYHLQIGPQQQQQQQRKPEQFISDWTSN